MNLQSQMNITITTYSQHRKTRQNKSNYRGANLGLKIKGEGHWERKYENRFFSNLRQK